MKNRDDSYLIGNKFAKKSDKPKPPGEWTEVYVHNITGAPMHYCMTLSDCHNAALAAERLQRGKIERQLKAAQRQLAAWRKNP